MDEYIKLFVDSWSTVNQGYYDLSELVSWVDVLNQKTEVQIEKCALNEDAFWYYNEENGSIQNRAGSFFSITGLQKIENDKVVFEQPIIMQNEIGYLGILCKVIDGVMHFLMQAKIEPGNINNIQISPTIQATKSNFQQKHGGKRPNYLEFFLDAEKYTILFDQIQSEQSSRFYHKRNRNIMVMLPEEAEVPEHPNYRWMTLGQIKELMKIDNLVNMDTRTVIANIPYALWASEADLDIQKRFKDAALYNSIFVKPKKNYLPQIYRYINNKKMFNEIETKIVALDSLSQWERTKHGVFCKGEADYQVIFCDIAIEGREVQNWQQPLFEARGKAIFGLFTRVNDENRREFLVHGKEEIGCFDQIELGPTLQLEPVYKEEDLDEIEKAFLDRYESGRGVVKNVILSEEGGRFYHEENKNIIIELDNEEMAELPEGYFWVDFYTLNHLIQVNNCLNIQLRNLLSLLEM